MNISILSEEFGKDGITVTLQWSPVNSSLISYNVSVIPQAAIIFNETAVAQLVIPYNTLYSVSISASVPCSCDEGTATIILNYSELLPHTAISLIPVWAHAIGIPSFSILLCTTMD